MDAAILAKCSPAPAGVVAVRYLGTITDEANEADENRLETYKLMAVRVEVEG